MTRHDSTVFAKEKWRKDQGLINITDQPLFNLASNWQLENREQSIHQKAQHIATSLTMKLR